MRIHFVIEGGQLRGLGHLVRSGALANALDQLGFEITFEAPDIDPKSLSTHFPYPVRQFRRADALVLDGLELDPGAFRHNFPGKIIAIDDLNERNLSGADLIVNPNGYAPKLKYTHPHALL